MYCKIVFLGICYLAGYSMVMLLKHYLITEITNQEMIIGLYSLGGFIGGLYIRMYLDRRNNENIKDVNENVKDVNENVKDVNENVKDGVTALEDILNEEY